MKRLTDFILETESVTKVNSVKVIYYTKESVTIKVPNNYSESDMQIYLDDVCLKTLPGTSESSRNMLGANNISKITDAYFEYSKFEASNTFSGNIDIDWDPKYGQNIDSNEFMYYSIKNLKYIITFSEFSLSNVNDDEIKEQLMKIFKTFDSGEINKYPIPITLEDVKFEK